MIAYTTDWHRPFSTIMNWGDDNISWMTHYYSAIRNNDHTWCQNCSICTQRINSNIGSEIYRRNCIRIHYVYYTDTNESQNGNLKLTVTGLFRSMFVNSWMTVLKSMVYYSSTNFLFNYCINVILSFSPHVLFLRKQTVLKLKWLVLRRRVKI